MEQSKIPQSALRFLAVAQLDLKAARCLYDNGYYPQAVFYLEQSVEKGLKSFAIFAGIITEQEARRPISHQTMKIYSKTTTGFKERIDTINSQIHSDPKFERMFEGIVDSSRMSTQVSRTLDFIQTVSKENISTISKDDKRLRNYLVSLEKLHQEYTDIQYLNRKSSVDETEFRAFKRNFLNMIKRYYEDQPAEYKKIQKEIDEQLTYDLYTKSMEVYLSHTFPPVFIYSSFFYLTRLLAPHALARYPDGEFNPMNYYHSDLPLIRSFDELNQRIDATLRALEDFINKNTREVIYVPS